MKRVVREVPPVRMLLVLSVLVLSSGCRPPDPGAEKPEVVEVEDGSGASLGSVAVPVSCAPKAGTHLRRGVALLHNMTYKRAAAEFRVATGSDPGCALAYWGLAMSYVHPVWPDVPSGADFEQGGEYLARARSLGPLGGRERAYVSALESYYRDWEGRSEPARLSSYFEGWDRALSEFPDDPEIRLFRSLSLTAVAATSENKVELQTEAGEMAEGVLAEIPDHTGALHYIIHAYDLPELADRALSAARRYGEAAPGNQHAQHMTSHIFTRVGSWEESIRYNRRSVSGVVRTPTGSVSHHYLHAADYLAYALLQRGDDEGARQVWAEMAGLGGPVFDHSASAYAFAAVPARIALERRDWPEAIGLRSRWPATVRWEQYPQFEAITEFARGIGAARAGDLEVARAAVDRLSLLRDPAAAAPVAYDWGRQVRIQEVAVRAWIAYAEGRVSRALAFMKEAQELEATTRKHPVTPGEVLPAAELLGDMLRGLGRHEEAVQAYESALNRSPNRLNSLFGAGRAAEAAGDAEAARGYYRQLLEIVAPESTRSGVAEARAYLAAADGLQ